MTHTFRIVHILSRTGRGALLAAAFVFACFPSARADVIVYGSEDIPKAIPDNSIVGIKSELIVPDDFLVEDLDLMLDELLHESVSDLHIELRSPAGTNSVLIRSASENGILKGLGIRDNFIATVFDDQAPTNLRDAFLDNHVGSYNINHVSVAQNPLSVFNGENAKGTWILSVSDRTRLDTGDLNQWSLRFTTTSAAVPEPSSVALLGVGLVLAAVVGRKKIRA